MMFFLRTGDLTEVPVPTRFIFILLGPQGNQGRYHEIGRSIATLMSDEVNISCSLVFLVFRGVNNKLEARAVFQAVCYRPHSKDGERLCFLFNNDVKGEGVPHIHPIIFPLVPCSFPREYPDQERDGE